MIRIRNPCLLLGVVLILVIIWIEYNALKKPEVFVSNVKNITDWNFNVNKTIALVFYGRKKQASILLRYLNQNVKENGGVLEKIIFAVKTNKKEDLEYLDSIMNQNKSYFERIDFGANTNFKELYATLNDDDLVFKIDDDIVFISNGTFEKMINEYLTHKLLFLSANVINHPLLSSVHARLRAILPFYEKKPYQWVKYKNGMELDGTEAGSIQYEVMSKWWKSPKCAAIVHESFLYHFKNNNLQVYDFNKWDFHSINYDRWSINFVLMRGKYVNKLKDWFPKIIDDEEIISVEIPKYFKKHSYAIGSAIVVHFSYFTQHEYLSNTNLIQKYDQISRKL